MFIVHFTEVEKRKDRRKERKNEKKNIEQDTNKETKEIDRMKYCEEWMFRNKKRKLFKNKILTDPS